MKRSHVRDYMNCISKHFLRLSIHVLISHSAFSGTLSVLFIQRSALALFAYENAKTCRRIIIWQLPCVARAL